MKEGEGSEEGSPRGSALIIGEELRSESRDRRQHLGSERDRKRDYDQPPSDLFAKFSLDRSKGTIIILSYSKARGALIPLLIDSIPRNFNRARIREFQRFGRNNKEGRSCFPFFSFAGDDTPRRLRARGCRGG